MPYKIKYRDQTPEERRPTIISNTTWLCGECQGPLEILVFGNPLPQKFLTCASCHCTMEITIDDPPTTKGTPMPTPRRTTIYCAKCQRKMTSSPDPTGTIKNRVICSLCGAMAYYKSTAAAPEKPTTDTDDETRTPDPAA